MKNSGLHGLTRTTRRPRIVRVHLLTCPGSQRPRLAHSPHSAHRAASFQVLVRSAARTSDVWKRTRNDEADFSFFLGAGAAAREPRPHGWNLGHGDGHGRTRDRFGGGPARQRAWRGREVAANGRGVTPHQTSRPAQGGVPSLRRGMSPAIRKRGAGMARHRFHRGAGIRRAGPPPTVQGPSSRRLCSIIFRPANWSWPARLSDPVIHRRVPRPPTCRGPTAAELPSALVVAEVSCRCRAVRGRRG